jgi:Fe2+-dicitrate sensor, membrane component
MKSIIKEYFDPTVSSEKKEELLQQIYEDKNLLTEFSEVKNIEATFLLQPMPDDKRKGEKAFNKFYKRHKPALFRKLFFRIASYAATGLIFITLWNIFVTYNDFPSNAGLKTVTVPPGQRTLVTLDDKTEIWLNSSTELEYLSGAKSPGRKVKLTGTGYFQVTPNPETPFIVETRSLQVKVTGTSFNLAEYGDEGYAEVGLVEGTIDIIIRDTKKQYSLVAGEKLSYNKGLVNIEQIDKDDYLWRDGIYNFNKIRFEELAKRLELHYDVTIEIQNPNLKNRLYTGKFRQQDSVAEILRILQKTFSFTINREEEKNHFIIR